jgi:hypothetical protein
VIPYGTILMWSGSIATIPTGWNLCDGTNGTPDLRNKFIIGAHSDNAGIASTTITGSPGSTGGTKDAIVVDHTHSITDPTHSHEAYSANQSESNAFGGPSIPLNVFTVDTNFAVTGITINNEGIDGTNQNIPPFYSLAYIMKIMDETVKIIV